MMFVIKPMCFAQPAPSERTPDLLPSEALLEFLLEFESVDDEAFDLVVQRGVNDVEQTPDDDDEAADIETERHD